MVGAIPRDRPDRRGVSPFPDTGIRQLDWPGILLTFGGRYAFDRSSIEFSLTEDPDTAGAPDFIANVGWTQKFLRIRITAWEPQMNTDTS